ncbi:hypothetical protein Q5M85_12375 [Paraclostridium bifermentans]|nr:hypothetical protein [Paraclostridium bifermentans]
MALHSSVKRDEKVLVHTAPIYPTTNTSIDMLGIETISADYNNVEDIKNVIENNKDIKGCNSSIHKTTAIRLL